MLSLRASILAYKKLEGGLKTEQAWQEGRPQVAEAREKKLAQAVGGSPSELMAPAPPRVDAATRTSEPVTVMTTGGRSADQETKSPPVCSREKKQLLKDVRAAMDSAIRELCSYLAEYWGRGATGLATDQEKIEPGDLRFVLAENLVALRFYNYIRYVVTEMRNILFFAAMAISLLFISLHTYAFRAGRSIDLSFVFLFLFLGTGVIWVLAQMERDPLLSRLQGTEAGNLGKNFYLDVAKYGIVPLLTIISSQVPWISNLLLGWFQPTLDVVR